jgi:hypothetical protein
VVSAKQSGESAGQERADEEEHASSRQEGKAGTRMYSGANDRAAVCAIILVHQVD